MDAKVSQEMENNLTASEDIYNLRHYVSRCADVGDFGEICDILLNFDYLQDKVNFVDVYELIRDFNYLAKIADLKKRDYYHEIRRALEISAPIINTSPRQLGGQMMGRLGEKRIIQPRYNFFENILADIKKNLTNPLSMHFRKQQIQPSHHSEFIESIPKRITSPWIQPLFASFNPADSILVRRIKPSISNGFSDFILLKNNRISIAIDKSSFDNDKQHYLSYLDLETGESFFRISLPHIAGFDHYQLAISPDEKILLIYDTDIIIWDVASRQILNEYQGDHHLVRLQFTTDMNYLIGSDWDGGLLMWDLVDNKETRILAHEGRLESFQISPDNKTVLTGGHDRFIRLWDIVSREKLAEHDQHPHYILSVHISDDGRWAKTISDPQSIGDFGDQTITLYWDLQNYTVVTNTKKISLRFLDGIYTKDQKIQFQRLKSYIGVFNVNKQRLLYAFQTHASNSIKIQLTNDNKYLITLADDENMFVWDVNTILNSPDKVKMFNDLFHHNEQVSSTAITSDGRLGVTASWDGTLLIWDMKSQTVRHRIQALGGMSIYSIVITPDDTTVIAGGKNGLIAGWNLYTGNSTGVFAPMSYKHQEDVTTLAVHPSIFTPLLASGSGNSLFGFMGQSSGELKLWNYFYSTFIGDVYQDKEIVSQVIFSPDGAVCVFGTGNTLPSQEPNADIFILNLADGSVRALKVGFKAIGTLKFSADGQFLAASEGMLFGPGKNMPMVVVFKIATWEPICKYLHDDSNGLGHIGSLIFTSENRYLIGGLKAGHGSIYVWEFTQGSQVEILPSFILSGHTDDVNKVLIMSDNLHLISIGADQTIRLWHLEEKRELAVLQTDNRITDASLSPDNQTILAGSADGHVHMFKINLG